MWLIIWQHYCILIFHNITVFTECSDQMNAIFTSLPDYIKKMAPIKCKHVDVSAHKHILLLCSVIIESEAEQNSPQSPAGYIKLFYERLRATSGMIYDSHKVIIRRISWLRAAVISYPSSHTFTWHCRQMLLHIEDCACNNCPFMLRCCGRFMH